MSINSIPETLEIPVEGMSCAACSARLEKRLGALDGVLRANVNLGLARAQVEFVPAQVTATDITKRVEKTGFRVPHSHVEFKIEGVASAADAAGLEEQLSGLDGVVSAGVDLSKAQGRVEFQPAVAHADEIFDYVARAGYTALPMMDEEQDAEKLKREREFRKSVRLLVLSAVLSAPLLFQMAGMIPGAGGWELPRWWQFALATPVQFIVGWRFYRGAYHSLMGGGANMDVLVALGTSAAWLHSSVVTFWGLSGHHVYFEASAVLITLIVLGKVLEERAMGRTSEAIKKLMGLQAKTARVLRDGEEREIPVSEVRVGDVEALGRYQDAVFERTTSYLATATEEDLEREIPARNGTESVGEAISLHMMGHFNGHRGEINTLRGMQGMPTVMAAQGTH